MQKHLIGFALMMFAVVGGLVSDQDVAFEKDPEPLKLARPTFSGPVNPTLIPDPVPVAEPVVEVLPEPKQKTEVKPEPFVESKPSPEPKVEPKLYRDPVTGLSVPNSTIIMVSMPTCVPCQVWWATYSQALKRGGWNVIKHEQPVRGVRSVPFFRVLVNGKWFPHQGSLQSRHLKEMIAAPVVEKTIAIGKTWSITKSNDRSRSWLQNGKPWTRQSLLEHLYQSRNHRFPSGSLDHLSLEELDRLHTADHEGGG